MLAVVLIVALLQVSSQPAAPPGPPPRDERPAAKGTGVIRGSVVADDTGAPIRGCHVTLMGARPALEASSPSTRTNEDGTFEFTGLAAGKYRLLAWPDPMNARYQSPTEDAPFWTFGKPFDLADGQKLEVPKIRLPRASVLTGRVLDDFGEPAAHIQVSAVRQMDSGEPARVQSDNTDDLGRFRLFGLLPGVYFVQAEPQNLGDPNASTPVRLLPTYLPSASTLGDATSIRVAAGQEVGDLEIRLVSGRTFRVSGVVTTSKGQPFSSRNGDVSLAETTVGGGMSSRGVDLKENGAFEINGVRPGMYSLEVQPSFRHPDVEAPADIEYATVPIVVGSEDVDGVTVVTQPGASIPGEVVFDEAPTGEPPSVEVTAMPAGHALAMFSFSRARVAPDGSFLLKGLHRPVYVRVTPPVGHHLASITYEGQNITDTPMEFRAGTPGKLVVTLTRRASSLSGEVHDSTDPVSSLVLAFGEDRSLWTHHATTTKFTQSDESGKYTFSGLRPGNYLVVALAPSSGSGSWMMNSAIEYWESLAKQATPVTIGDDERKVLNLKLVSQLDR
jgi:Carboxypeptidase regulatory-like domain